jgi:transcriptional regulator GlxA family with amidase domain
MVVEYASTHGISPARLNGAIKLLLTQARQSFDEDPRQARVLVAQIVNLFDQGTLVDRVAVSGGLAAWQVNRVNRFINANLATPLTVSQLAVQAQLSASYFIRAFKVSFGTTPRAYVLRKRIERAKELMRSTSDALADIAVACGLSDQSHLNRLFRRFTGMSPLQWRRSQTEWAGIAARLYSVYPGYSRDEKLAMSPDGN